MKCKTITLNLEGKSYADIELALEQAVASIKAGNDKAQGAGGGLIAGGSPGAAGSAARTTEKEHG